MGHEVSPSWNAAKQSWRSCARSFCAKWAVPLLLLAVAGAFPFLYGWLRSRTTLANGGLTIEASYLDFGNAWQDSRVALKLPLKNPTSSPVEVANVQLTCGCTLVKPTAFTIQPGETRELNVEIKFDVWPQNERHLDKRRFQVSIRPVLSQPIVGLQHGWVVNGIVSKLLKLTTSDLSLPDKLIAGEPFSPIDITATYAVPLDGLTAECIPPNGKAIIQGGPEHYDIQVAPNADLAVGPVFFEVMLKPFRKGEELPAAKLPIRGAVHRVVEANPARATLGALAVGEVGNQTVVLSSPNGKAFTVKSWQSTRSDLTVEPLDGAGQETKRQAAFRVSQRITGLGSQEAFISFIVRLEDLRELEVRCPVQYHGIAAALRTR